jgi:hypothetical protein
LDEAVISELLIAFRKVTLPQIYGEAPPACGAALPPAQAQTVPAAK